MKTLRREIFRRRVWRLRNGIAFSGFYAGNGRWHCAWEILRLLLRMTGYGLSCSPDAVILRSISDDESQHTVPAAEVEGDLLLLQDVENGRSG